MASSEEHNFSCHLTRRYSLPALHKLSGHCEELHGHEYSVEVTYSGAIDEVSGLCLKREILDDLVQEKILSAFYGKNLNELLPSTAGEFLAREFLRRLRGDSRGKNIQGLALQETKKNRFIAKAADLLKPTEKPTYK